ncbi:hypothetical protein ATO00_14185 [Loigolactobacillus coryniformis subsp. coryniformis]|uniref:Coaggregation promoting factor n=2 Tax=Loigolactobacillus coryniformis subsp. coryniformis TaxID=115541 RepID=A0A0R1ETA0_9LACO|nr:hypothetical protein LC20001_13830 [Loigolactobacillus coryniformis subsp. coryniformis KCTC 3167 = DSM 20001]KRK12489.1 coaggregation promoting factor [Loigolactobacillus coryniformis subsp. coryniformis KCTC 3167 = DSM 20001]OEH89027.1 hypothetical protein ATO00_14185 [Loigolactobacillus coryniformis subsp. coryniformis]
MLVGAAVLGIGSLGTVAQAATTPEPTTPTTPVTSEATAEITPGTITLSSSPSFQFGKVEASANDVSYNSTSVSGDLKIADVGTGTGYTVTVAASPFTAKGGAALKNAQLILNNKEVTPIKADDADNVSTPPTLVTNLTLSSSPVTVLNAAAGSGVGAYTGTYGATDASLKVPAGNIGGTYSSTLTWTLANAPA